MGLGLIKELEGINREESYLPRIFWPSSLNWHIYHRIYTAFWCVNISTLNMGSRPCMIDMSSVFLWLKPRSWRHNAGARELSANHSLRCMTTLTLVDLQRSVAVFAVSGSSGGCACRQKPRVHQNKTVLQTLPHQSVNECLKQLYRWNSSRNNSPVSLKRPNPLNWTFTILT